MTTVDTLPAAGTARAGAADRRGRAAGRPAPHRRRLFRKYVLLFVAVVSTALLASGILQISFGYRDQVNSIVRIQRGQAEAAAGDIGGFLDNIVDHLGWTTQLPWSADQAAQHRLDALRLLRQVPAITELMQLDASGREQLRVSRIAMDVVGAGTDRAAEPAFVAARAAGAWFGPVYFRYESEPYMTVAQGGTRPEHSVSVAEVNLKFIWDLVAGIDAGETGYAYVVDGSGRLLAHSDISLVLRNTDLSGLPQVAAALAGGPEPSAAHDLAGRGVVSASAAIPQLGWRVFVELPLREALAPIFLSMARTGGLLLLGLGLASLLGLYFTRRMLAPIDALRAGAARIGGGDLDRPLDIRTGDELDELVAAFNEMAAKLRKSYGELERRVRERTEELAEKGRQLELASQHKSQFLANMSHELRTPLNAILGYTELIADGIYGPVGPRLGEVVDRVQQNGQHLLELINEVLDLARIEAGESELQLAPYRPAEVVAGVAGAMEALARGKGLALRTELQPDPGEGTGDERRLTQVLLNLVGNAIKFTERGSVAISARRAGDAFVIEVRDTGIGIDPADQERIFGEFQQADSSTTRTHGGSGLGLAITRRIVLMHGGSIAVESSPGRGSTFRVTLPARARSVAG